MPHSRKSIYVWKSLSAALGEEECRSKEGMRPYCVLAEWIERLRSQKVIADGRDELPVFLCGCDTCKPQRIRILSEWFKGPHLVGDVATAWVQITEPE